jgi:hypothetical protein
VAQAVLRILLFATAIVLTVPTARAADDPVRGAVELRIVELHRTLGITPAQEAAWARVARVMKDDARVIAEIADHRRQDVATMTAVENLQSFQRLAAAHADGLRTLGTVFEALYDQMSDAQKKNADAVFRYEGGPGAAQGMTR